MTVKMIRLLLYILLIYIAFHVLRMLLRGTRSHDSSDAHVRGRQKQQSLDLSGMDVEDAKFEEIKKKH
jgi:hypothetical protein